MPQLRAEYKVADEKMRELMDEVQGRVGVQDALLQGLTSRVDVVERTLRTLGTRVGDSDAVSSSIQSIQTRPTHPILSCPVQPRPVCPSSPYLYPVPSAPSYHIST